MYDGPSSYLVKRERRKQTEREYLDSPEMRGPESPPVEVKELEMVRCAIQTVKRGMKGGETWDETQQRYRRLVDYGILERALEALQRYEKLLSNEPLVEQISNDWWKTGAFYDASDGIV